MKQITILLSILMLTVTSSKLYAQTWSEWVPFNNSAGVEASISFKIVSNCANMSYSFWRTNNSTYSQNGTLTFSYKYYNCNGELTTESDIMQLGTTGIKENEGQWFLTRGGGIQDIIIEELYMPDRKIWVKRVNGEQVDMWKEKYGNN
ncbi:MAG TPA: hypothetical protein VIJ75_08000 [Hanamia sp.]